jgi:hypothetical protein
MTLDDRLVDLECVAMGALRPWHVLVLLFCLVVVVAVAAVGVFIATQRRK